MPRDDLSIDFVKRMPTAEPLDPSLILDDWINRVQNLPEEIRFLQEEIADKDRQCAECLKTIEDRDGKIQRFIKANGSHTPNPKEDNLRAQIQENYTRADQLTQDKLLLSRKVQLLLDKHVRNLDAQIRILYDRAEPGFTDPDEVPSLLRSSAANHSAPTIRSANPAVNGVLLPGSAAGSIGSGLGSLAGMSTPLTPLNTVINAANPAMARIANPQIRNTQGQHHQHAASAPATPAAASLILGKNNARESSAGPMPKRPRVGSGLGTLPTPTSGLARHSSLGPGTPKGATAVTAASGVVRAGSAGPRTGTTKGANTAGSTRKSTPTGSAASRKKAGGTTNPTKSNLSRVKKASTKNSPASTADSELSDAESGSGDDDEEKRESAAAASVRGSAEARNGTPAGTEPKDTKGPPEVEEEEDSEDESDEEDAADGDDDEAGDDKKYCLCQNVSFGDMVACDNEDCPYEWFHWSCVGLKSEPNGTWYCPVCSEKMQKKK